MAGDERPEDVLGRTPRNDGAPKVALPREQASAGSAPTHGGERGTIRTFAASWSITPRVIQMVLGCIWIFDAALQYQPAMFGRAFVTQMILPNAHGQPTAVAWSITSMGHFLLPHAGAWNFLFATVQLAIGVGLLFRRWVRPALVLMFAWCLGVWWFGEGFGQLLTGNALPLTGAPGAVSLYAAIGVLVWPRREKSGAAKVANATAGRASRHVGLASSAAAKGPFGTPAALAVWSGFWILSAALWLLPANRSPGVVHDAISGAASGQPTWYAHFLTTFAGHFAGIGLQAAWLLALLSLIIGLGPWLTTRPRAFLVGGAALQLGFWTTGMGFGGIMTGMGTDPGTSPLIILLALSLLPTVAPVGSSAHAPATALLRWNSAVAGSVAAVALAAVVLSAAFPGGSTASAAASSQASGQAASSGTSEMSGMSGMSMGSSQGNSASAMKGMTGMGGLDAQDPNWHYTGPPIPAGEAAFLSAVSTDTDQGHLMQTPSCSDRPTATQVVDSMQYVQQTSAAVAKYKDPNAAVAAGYVPITDTAYPVVHYVNLAYMQQSYVMDPNHVQSLVYTFTPYGPVLVAAMYLMPRSHEQGPMPYGCLVQWHAHTNLCMLLSLHEYVGFTPCTPGTVNLRTPVMTHVWQVPVAGGPLALDPSDLQLVQAATQAQLDGQAPMQYPQGNAPPQPGPPGVGF